jgi:hypothetical protein
MSEFNDNETEASTKTDVKPAGGYEVGFAKAPVSLVSVAKCLD